MLGVATLALCTASLASLSNGYSPLTLGFHPQQAPNGAAFPSNLPATAVVPSQVSLGQALVQVLVALAVVAPLLMAIRYPLLGWRIGWLGLLLVPLLHERWWGGLKWDPVQILVLLTVLCLAGIRHERPVLCWLWALTLVPWWFWAARDGLNVVTATLGSVVFLAMAVAVDRVGSERRARQALADQADQTELERARLAVLEQRTRFARELHDVIAHHMSLMAIRAESAPHRLGELPEPVRAEFESLSGSAREALADMRRLLSVLRSDQPAAHAPQPGLEDLPGMRERVQLLGGSLSAGPAPGGGFAVSAVLPLGGPA
jgi:signal transduction histidine kinase